MRRTSALLATALLLTACGGKAASTTTAAPSATGSATASSSASASGGASPANTSFAPAPEGQPFTASATFGHEPTLAFPSATPPTTLVKAVVTEGTGPAVAKGDVLAADYVGQVWNGAVFDTSFKRGTLTAFPVGVAKVIAGWDETLVGVKAGSRVLLSIPPDKGYGAAGNARAGIKGTDTIVFVVDVVASYAPTLTAPPGAVAQTVDTLGVKVTGALDKEPTIVIPKGTPEPTAAKVIVLDKGTGAATAAGLTMVQLESVLWTGVNAGSTWKSGGLQGLSIGQGGALDALKGTPIGSRVLLLLPKDPTANTGHPAIAAVADIVAQPAVPS